MIPNYKNASQFKICIKCKLSKTLTKFERVSSFSIDKLTTRNDACAECDPSELLQEKREFLTLRRISTPCVKCEALPVFWYKTNGNLCDVFQYAEEGYSLKYIKRFLSQLTPKCEACAVVRSLTKAEQFAKQAEVFRVRAIREKDEAKQADLWRRHFYLLRKTKQYKEAELTGVEVEEEVEQTTDWYGGTDDV